MISQVWSPLIAVALKRVNAPASSVVTVPDTRYLCLSPSRLNCTPKNISFAVWIVCSAQPTFSFARVSRSITMTQMIGYEAS